MERNIWQSGSDRRCQSFKFNKQFKEQIRIVSEVLHSRNYNTKLKELIKGVMIESYLEEGCQSIGADQIYGKSITDPCLGWEDTERLIYKIAEEC